MAIVPRDLALMTSDDHTAITFENRAVILPRGDGSLGSEYVREVAWRAGAALADGIDHEAAATRWFVWREDDGDSVEGAVPSADLEWLTSGQWTVR